MDAATEGRVNFFASKIASDGNDNALSPCSIKVHWTIGTLAFSLFVSICFAPQLIKKPPGQKVSEGNVLI